MQDTQSRYSLCLAGKSQCRIVFILCIVGIVALAAGIGAPVSAGGATPAYVAQWGSAGSGNGLFDYPEGIAVNASDYIYVVDKLNRRVQMFSPDDNYLMQWGSYGTGTGQFNGPDGIAMNSSGYVYVADSANNRIQMFTSYGTYAGQWGSSGLGNGNFSSPQGIVVNASGYVYVTDTNNDRIQVFTPSGAYITQWGTSGSGNGEFYSPWGITVNSSGYVYVADNSNYRVQVFTPSGMYITQWGTSGSGIGQFNGPCGIAVDSNDDIYVTDTGGNNRIQVFTPSGAYITQWGTSGSGNGQFSTPYGVAVNTSGYVYVADTYNDRIEMFSPLKITLPAVTNISPALGPVSGATNVTITGSGFTGVSAVIFGSTSATSFTVNSDTSINAISPAEAAAPVHITVTNPDGTSATSPADQFTYGTGPGASFSANQTIGSAPLAVQFTDTSTGSPTAWNWSFGNGNFSTVQNPVYTYPSTGTFTVSLNATGTFGSNTSVRTNYIIVTGPTPSVDFNGTPMAGLAPLKVQFTDLSLNNPTGWAWFFGDENYTEPWTEMTTGAGWPGRDFQSSVVMPDGSIVLMGGNSNTFYNDVWRSTDEGASWTEQNANPGWVGRSDLSSVTMPDGSIVLMGGNSVSNGPLNDVWRSSDDGATWSEVNTNAGWPGRYSLRSVAMPDGSIVLMGGQSSGSNFFNDVWQSKDEGTTWTEVNTSAGWPARAGFNVVVMPDGSIVLMGGHTSGGSGAPLNDVWKSTDEGVTWTEVNASAGWSARYGQGSVAMPDGSIVLMGGRDSYGDSLNDVWRSKDDGATWTELPNAGWMGRYGVGSVAMPDGSIVFMGGYDGSSYHNDVWRLQPAGSSAQNPSHTYATPGSYQVALQAFNAVGFGNTRKDSYITVSPPLVAGFSANVTFGAPPLTVQFQDTSTGDPTSWNWSFGDGNYSTAQNPVYSYAILGTYTVNLTASNALGNDTLVKTSYINVCLAPAASFTATPTSGAVPLTIQFSDTSTGSPSGWAWFFGDENYTEPWTQKTASAGWAPRTYQSSVVMPDGSIIFMGGGGTSNNNYNDVWRSKDDGATWTQVDTSSSSSMWTPRYGQSSVVMPDGSIVLMGGDQNPSSGAPLNDVWRSTDEGATWTEVNTSPGWSPREVFSSVAMPDGSIVLMGGMGTNDVWRSTDDGKTWTKVNENAEWPIRWAESSVAMPDGSIVLMGGQGVDNVYLNDVWRSTDEGATWTEVNTSPGWPARTDFSSVAMPDGSIVLMGGWTSSGNMNDVWRSTDDGATWTELPNAGWPARYGQSSVAMPDGSIVILGGGGTNDVWQLTPTGSTIQSPSHTYATPGIYPVALQAYNAGGYNSTLKTGYITISAPPVAGFSANVTSGAPGLTVQFQDTSTGVPTSWNWDFGDGTFSTLQNPIHTYAHSGYYTVSLTATNALGTNTLVSASYVDVYPPPVASFTSDVTSGFRPLSVSFTDTSTGSPSTWAWFFGDETYNEGWNEVNSYAGWNGRTGQSSVAMPDGSIVLMGGWGDNGDTNDVWQSWDDGATWTEINSSAGWSGREGQSSVAMPDGSIVLMGGWGDNGDTNDVWQSWDDGATWTEINPNAWWSGRDTFSSVAMPDGSIVLMGGYDESGNFDNDVWQSWDDGATWTEINPGAGWSGRYGQSCVIMPDGSIILMGGEGEGLGEGENGDTNDVWRSTDDGATWTEINPSAGWSARDTFSSVAMPDGSIVLMGGEIIGGDDENGIYLNDVWQLWPAGSYSQNPSHNYDSPGTYQVALQVSNSVGYNSTLIPGYITVTEPPAESAPVAGFTATPTSGPLPLTVSFTDQSTNSPSTWAWFFGDETYNEGWNEVNSYAGWNGRYGQSSVVMPDGSIVLMGGWGDNGDTNDVWQSWDDGASWNEINASAGWSVRDTFSSVVMPDGSIVLMGGEGDNGDTNDVWQSWNDGATWIEINASAGWSARDGQSSVVMPDGSIVLMGGYDWNGNYDNDVWQSWDDGASWNEVNSYAGWSGRCGQSSVVMPDGSIVLMGGCDWNGNFDNDVWQSWDDGASWNEITPSAGWPGRVAQSSVVMPDGSIVLMGGYDWNGDTNDVWRSTDDGATWTEINPSAGWSARDTFSSVAMPDGSIVLMGGWGDNGDTNDVWQLWPAGSYNQDSSHTYTTPGIYQVALQVSNSGGYNSTIIPGYITVTGPPVEAAPAASFTATPTSGFNPLTVQFTDTSTGIPSTWAWFFGDETYNEGWNQVSTNTPIWTPRYNQSSVVMPDGSIVLMGGYSTPDGSSLKDDVWLSPDDGATWTEMNTSAGWAPRYGQSSVVMPDGSIVLMGGYDGTTYYNDVWQSWDDGATWTELNNGAPWSGRYGQSCVIMPDGSIVLMGGQDSNGLDDDVWQSWDDGATWTQVSWGGYWTARYGQSSVVMPDGSIVLMGGYDGSPEDDVWQSWNDGATWSWVNWAPWSGRYGQSCGVMPDGSIILMGGYDGSPEDDVWQSPPGSDGAIWNEVNYGAISSGRYGQSSLAMPDGSIILMGGYDGSNYYNDVWQLQPAGSYSQNPSHIYSSQGTYQVALQVSNSLGYNSTIIPGYITVQGPPSPDFTANVTFGTAPLTVQFNDTSTSSPASWIWNFGDGTTSTDQNPVHTYGSTGNFTVSLTATNPAGSSNPLVRTGYIVVTGPKPIAGFVATPTSGSLPLTVSFTDQSTKNPTGWAWFFGDENYTEPWTLVNTSTGWLGALEGVAMPDGSIVLTQDNWGNGVLRSTDNGATWSEVNDQTPWSNRQGQSMVAMPDDSIVLMGGSDWYSNLNNNDVWRSTDDGTTWTEVNANAGWSARSGQSSVAMPDGSIVLMGGSNPGVVLLNDVWRSTDDGATWTLMNASAGWSARSGQSSVVMPDGSIVLMGGYDGNPKNDTWRSTDDGATWTEQNASSGWSARTDFSSVAMPDGSIVLMGGYSYSNGGRYLNDMWRSTDEGVTWTEVNSNAQWRGDGGQCSVAMADGSIVLMQGYESDVWRFMPTGSSEQNPSHTYTAPGIYPVSLQAYNAGGFNSKIQTGYITVLGAPAPDFTANITFGTAPLAVQFNDTSDIFSPLMWNWSFGDGTWFNTTDIAASNASYVYSTPGTYDISLTVTNASGSNTATQIGYISIAESTPYIEISVNGSLNNWNLVTGLNQDTSSVSLNITTNMDSWSVNAVDGLDGGKPSDTAGHMAEYDGSSYVPSGAYLQNPLNVSFGGGPYIALSVEDQTLTSGTSPGTTPGILGISQLISATDTGLAEGHKYRMVITLTGGSST